MYKIKEEIQSQKRYGTVRRLARKTGLSEGYVSQVLNGTRTISEKVYAFAITKAINTDFEIENVFEII